MCILITFDIRIKLSLWMNWVVFLPFLLWMSFDAEAIIKFSTFSWLTSSDWWNFIHDQNMMTISVSVVHRIKKISSKSLVVLVLPFQYMDPFSMRLMKMLNLGISLFSRTGVLLLWPSMWMYGRSENQLLPFLLFPLKIYNSSPDYYFPSDPLKNLTYVFYFALRVILCRSFTQIQVLYWGHS